ncbi:hypothetical protein AGDE_03825 [Angomonas deanei]|uniref:Uncharacterized protein n=1 Tax=Angomonas deanei TaxID=59799 RepID=A0A7G2CJ16_9TRYP|nr:hypothetical protein AGDE_03825 [Angomonas deanei]CAD2219838.1 hypothetical protein, conserved [Angomonas deanei]|eukprot:EPY40103.1 hypothetical protein AGDE_03825 [Angomonas deanei]
MRVTDAQLVPGRKRRRGRRSMQQLQRRPHPPSPPKVVSHAMGWDYAPTEGGKTELDRLYDVQLSQIHKILGQPLPPLPKDGSVEPDFFIGFSHYSYRLRDEYRAVIALYLSVPIEAVQLSIAWSGRFDVARFNRSRKVCGVVLSRKLLSPKEGEEGELPDKVKERIAQLIRLINKREEEQLLRSQFCQAGEATPEVEFEVSRREQRLLARLHEWLLAQILRPHLVVIVYGGNYVAEDAARYVEHERQQREMIELKWVKSFHRREVIPQLLSLRMLTSLLSAAVVRGEVENVHVEAGKEDNLLPDPLQTIVRDVGEKAEQCLQQHAGKSYQELSGEKDLPLLLAEDVTPSAVDWLNLTRRALMLHSSAGGANVTAPLPALFVHGAYGGGAQEMRYLQYNKSAMDVLLLHANDVAVKRKIKRRQASGQNRLRIHEEVDGSSSAARG